MTTLVGGIDNAGTGGGAGTVTNTGGALTNNSFVLGAGGNDTKVSTAFVTNGTNQATFGVAGGGNGVLALSGNTSGTATLTAPAVAGTVSNAATFSNSLIVSGPQVTVSAAGNGNGVLALSGNTSGTATLTAPATAGTSTNAVLSSNVINTPAGTGTAAAYGFTATPSLGWWNPSGAIIGLATNAATASVAFTSNTISAGSGGVFALSGTANDATAAKDTGYSRLAAGVSAFGNGTAGNKSGLIQSGMSTFVTSNFTTSGVGTALEAITGLSITVPALAANWTFHCHLAYSQAVGNAAVAFGIQAVTNNPTNIFATGIQQITVGPPATIVTGTLATLATTTATNIVSGTPGATATNYTCDLYGTCELGASANTIRILVSTATAADLVTVLRGSYFHFNC